VENQERESEIFCNFRKFSSLRNFETFKAAMIDLSDNGCWRFLVMTVVGGLNDDGCWRLSDVGLLEI
jgi:hypothetical protein